MDISGRGRGDEHASREPADDHHEPTEGGVPSERTVVRLLANFPEYTFSLKSLFVRSPSMAVGSAAPSGSVNLTKCSVTVALALYGAFMTFTVATV